MARKYAKVSKRVSRSKRTGRRYRKYHRTGYSALSRRISAVSRRVAGEVNKFEITPDKYKNAILTYESATQYSTSENSPLLEIQSGTPWVMPLNWYYTLPFGSFGSTTYAPFYNGMTQGFPQSGSPVNISLKEPIYYSALYSNENNPNIPDDSIATSTDYQYRLKYIYINALFNASINSSTNNTDGALRIVIIKDKQPTGGSATWYDSNKTANSRGVFNANRIDAQLNPQTVGRFRIMYDKTLRFTTINGYKPFKYFKRLSTITRNNRVAVNAVPTVSTTNNNYAQTNDESPPVQKNAYYLLIFSDGLNFTYTSDSSTPANSFHLFNRIAYYNN